MALLWNPESWPQRLAELEAQSGELKEAPLRRDVRSLGMLLGEVLREQAGDELFSEVESLRQGTIRRRDAEASGDNEEAGRSAASRRNSRFYSRGHLLFISSSSTWRKPIIVNAAVRHCA